MTQMAQEGVQEAGPGAPSEAPADTSQQLLKEAEAKYLYLYSEFENYKRRAAKERSEFAKFAWEGVASDLIAVLDNIQLALAHAPEGVDPNWKAGLQMVAQQFLGAMERNGVQEVPSQAGVVFDPNVHEAVSQEVSDLAPGLIVRAHTRGYTLHGRLLRPARVVVSQAAAT